MRRPSPGLALTLALAACASAGRTSADLGFEPVRADAIEVGGDGYERWVIERLAAAPHDVIEVPLVSHSDGWGCDCPDFYFGDSVGTGGWPFVRPEGMALPEHRAEGWIMRATGWLTGEKTRYVGEDPSEYDMLGFHVVKLEPWPDDAPFEARVV
ncbi:MAG: hypothetical protein U1F43_36945, partial [Myxococcota bacterium]